MVALDTSSEMLRVARTLGYAGDKAKPEANPIDFVKGASQRMRSTNQPPHLPAHSLTRSPAHPRSHPPAN